MAIVALAVLLVAAGGGCSAPVRNYACAIEPAAGDIVVHDVWSCNRDVLRRAAGRKPFSLREFGSTVRFFENLTGIELDTRWSHLGRLPGRSLKRDLAALDAWYELNRSALSWDPGLGTVVFAGLARAPGAV